MYAFHRQRDNDWVTVVVNLSDKPQTFRLMGEGYEGMYTDVFSHQSLELRPYSSMTLQPWGYRVFTN
ncbi:alpha-glucosidase C-terminal domain-containing protein [Spirosoma rhododendri]|uniref:alpha-glucosidase C-terminal domain-containing protein n=1 Tax=Spirosoma rhododendri TaxID=2728024 RepID=UPI002FCDA585